MGRRILYRCIVQGSFEGVLGEVSLEIHFVFSLHETVLSSTILPLPRRRSIPLFLILRLKSLVLSPLRAPSLQCFDPYPGHGARAVKTRINSFALQTRPTKRLPMYLLLLYRILTESKQTSERVCTKGAIFCILPLLPLISARSGRTTVMMISIRVLFQAPPAVWHQFSPPSLIAPVHCSSQPVPLSPSMPSPASTVASHVLLLMSVEYECRFLDHYSRVQYSTVVLFSSCGTTWIFDVLCMNCAKAGTVVPVLNGMID